VEKNIYNKYTIIKQELNKIKGVEHVNNLAIWRLGQV
jgi:hypothetical protein